MNGKIVFNGKEYNGIDEMPAEVRQAYQQVMGIFADKNQNGVPDLFEGMAGSNVQALSSQIIFEGKVYNYVNDLPPEARARYEQAMSKLDQDKNGVLDIFEGKGMAGLVNAPSATPPTENVIQAPPIAPTSSSYPASPSVITPDKPQYGLIAAGVIIALFVCAAIAAAAMLYLR